jgi:two-component system NarL family sensor kinase
VLRTDKGEAPVVGDPSLVVAADTRQSTADESCEIVTSYGRPGGEILRLPLVYQHEAVGTLLLAPRTPGEAFTPADLHVLADLARPIAISVQAVRLTVALQHSRERLVLAREEERRRLRRDLHDDLGPTLASLAQRLDTAATLIPRNPQAAVALVGDLKTRIRATLSDIRRLVYTLRPATLDELGLASAIREYAGLYSDEGGRTAAPRVVVYTPENLPPLPAAIEAAAYRIGLEALTNVLRHAHAQTCHVRLSVDDALVLEIIDDGIGLPPNARMGIGRASMHERAAELGGECRIEPAMPHGTRVWVRLPVPKE